MEEISGIKVARTLKDYPNVPLLIFVFALSHYMSDLFQFGTFRFFEKPIKFDLLEDAFNEALQVIEEKRPHFHFKFQQKTYQIVLKQIVYFESRQRLIYIWCAQGEWYRFYGHLDDIENYLKEYYQCFVRCHQSYLLNVKYIQQFDTKSVHLHLNNKRVLLPISQSRQQEFLSKINNYINTCD